MTKQRTRPRKGKIRRLFTLTVLAVAAAAGWHLRDCTEFGLGPGSDQQASETAQDSNTSSAKKQPDSAPPRRQRCQLRLSSRGLTLDRKSIEIPEAVRACKDAKEVKLRVTGGARSGTYDQLKRAFERAKIPLDVRDGRVP